MNTESLEFIQTLFARASVGAVALTALPVEQGSALTCHVPLTMTSLLTQAVSRLQMRNANGTASALVGIATRRPGLSRYQRGGKTDLLELPALYADIDQPPADVFPLLSHFRPSPSLVVASGLGTHLYWLLAEPATDFFQCDRILTGLAQALGGDRLTVAQSMCMLRGISLRWIHIHRNGGGRILPPPWEKAKVCAAERKTGSLSAMR